MALINCPECNNHQISATEGTICPSCGFKVDNRLAQSEKEKTWSQTNWFFMGLMIVFGAGFLQMIGTFMSHYIGIVVTLIFNYFFIVSTMKHDLINNTNKFIIIGLLILIALSFTYINITEIFR